jgi:hypothetical protein
MMGAQRIFLAVGCAALILPALAPASPEKKADIAKLQARFDKETNGERKAKELGKLCDAQIEAERSASDAKDFKTVGFIMEKYRDNVKAAFQALQKTHPNARKKPGGYKRLELQALRGLREVNDLLLVIPDPYKPPMQIVQKDLAAMDDELLLLLFPDRPPEKPLPSKSKLPTVAPPPKEKNP